MIKSIFVSGMIHKARQPQPSVIAAYEKRIAKLEEDKLVSAEKAANPTGPKQTFEEMFEHAVRFLSNSWEIWKKGDLAWKRTVLNLAFLEPIAYDRENGVRTPKTTLPFKALGRFNMKKLEWRAEADVIPTPKILPNLI